MASDGTLYVGYQQYTNSERRLLGGRAERGRQVDRWRRDLRLDRAAHHPGRCVFDGPGRARYLLRERGSYSFRSRSHPIMGISPTNPSLVYMVYSGGDLESAYTCGGSTGFHGDTLFRHSTDGGATFTAPVKINTDPQGKDQYYPWIDVCCPTARSGSAGTTAAKTRTTSSPLVPGLLRRRGRDLARHQQRPASPT